MVFRTHGDHTSEDVTSGPASLWGRESPKGGIVQSSMGIIMTFLSTVNRSWMMYGSGYDPKSVYGSGNVYCKCPSVPSRDEMTTPFTPESLESIERSQCVICLNFHPNILPDALCFDWYCGSVVRRRDVHGIIEGRTPRVPNSVKIPPS